MSEPTRSAQETARLARQASSELARFDGLQRTLVLRVLADRLEQNVAQILQANEKDCRAAARAVDRGEMTPSLYKRLKLDEYKLRSVIDGIRQVAALPDPLGKVEMARELDNGLQLKRVRCPLGVVLVIFEARPDALPQIASLLIKSGNAGLLKGGREARHSNEAIMSCIDQALFKCEFPQHAYTLVPGRQEANKLLAMHKYIDLVIPRGSGELVRKIQESTQIPVLGHAEGVCHLYIDRDADPEMAVRIALDAKTNYPAACNSIETILVHRDQAKQILPWLASALQEAAVQIRMPTADASEFGITSAATAREEDWSCEYSDLIVSVKVVRSIGEAIRHINEYGSAHTDAIVTRNPEAFEIFFAEVNSAGVYWNASTRFADGFRYGFGAEVGISTGKLHPRGPVGVDGITTYKYRLEGRGHVVADYTGEGARQFTHKDLQADELSRNTRGEHKSSVNIDER